MSNNREVNAAVAYVRISSDALQTGLGVARQLTDIEELARARGLELIATFQDNDISATGKKPRPQFEAMLKAASDPDCGFSTIIVWSVDRMYRKMSDLERIITALEPNNVSVLTVKAGSIRLDSPDGKLLARLLGSVAAAETDKLADRVSRRAKQRATEEGRTTTGTRPFGYDFGAEGLTVNSIEADALVSAFEQFAEGKSLSAIAADLTDKGLKSTRGGPITQARVSSWLRTKRYVGIATYKGAELGPTKEPALIEQELWDKVQLRLNDPSRLPKRGRPAVSLLGGLGLLKCSVSECGGNLTHASNTSSRKGVPFTYSTYACQAKHVNKDRDLVDAHVTNALIGYLDKYGDRIKDSAQTRSALVGGSEVSAALVEQEQLNERLTTLSELVAAGTLPAEDYALAVGAIRRRLGALEVPQAVTPTTSAVLSRYERLQGWASRWESLTMETRRQVASEVILRINVSPGNNLNDCIEVLFKD